MADGLHIYVGANLTDLAVALANLLSNETSFVLEPEWMIIPSAAVRQWLDWELSTHLGCSPARQDGVTANLKYFFPEEFVRKVHSSTVSNGDHSPFDVTSLTLRLLQQTPQPSYRKCRSNAELIDELIRWRPDYIDDPSSAPPSAHQIVNTYLNLTQSNASPIAERELVIDLIRQARPATLPSRLFLFGSSTVPGGPQFARLIAALSKHMEVHVFVPCADIHLGSQSQKSDTGLQQNDALTMWLQDSREALDIWQDSDPSTLQWHIIEPTDAPLSSTLGVVQSWIKTRDTAESPDDTSIRIIGCVGASRQIEICRDQIFDAISTDGLRTDQILVVTNDPERFAASFERHWDHDFRGPRLPFEIVDVAASTTNRLAAATEFLSIVNQHITVDQIEHVFGFEAFSSGTALSEDQWDRLWHLTDEAPVTFGTSPVQRDGLDVYGQSPKSRIRRDAGSWNCWRKTSAPAIGCRRSAN